MKDKIQQADIEAEKKYPGAAIDRADGEKVSDAAVDDRVKVENNNPRNEEGTEKVIIFQVALKRD